MNDRIRLLQVCTGFKPGGAERLLLQLVAALDKRRFATRVASLSPQLEALEAYDFAGTEVSVCDMTQSRIRGLRALARLLDEFTPHIVHAHMFHALVGTLGARLLSGVQPQVCFTSHNTVHKASRAAVMRLSRHFRSADIIFQPGQHEHLNAANCVVIRNGVCLKQNIPRRTWIESGRPLRFLSVGSLTNQKDPIGAVQSFLAADLPGALLEFAGDGELETALRSVISKANANDRIILHGFRSDVRRLMREADCFIMHSKWEGMPMALLEAGAEGMPVVATPVGSIPTILGSNRGLLATPAAFPDALRRIAADPAGALTMGDRLRTHVAKHYSLEATVRAHERLYEELAACAYPVQQQGMTASLGKS